jgi:hypothetical protein
LTVVASKSERVTVRLKPFQSENNLSFWRYENGQKPHLCAKGYFRKKGKSKFVLDEIGCRSQVTSMSVSRFGTLISAWVFLSTVVAGKTETPAQALNSYTAIKETVRQHYVRELGYTAQLKALRDFEKQLSDERATFLLEKKASEGYLKAVDAAKKASDELYKTRTSDDKLTDQKRKDLSAIIRIPSEMIREVDNEPRLVHFRYCVETTKAALAKIPADAEALAIRWTPNVGPLLVGIKLWFGV